MLCVSQCRGMLSRCIVVYGCYDATSLICMPSLGIRLCMYAGGTVTLCCYTSDYVLCCSVIYYRVLLHVVCYHVTMCRRV